VAVAGLLQLIPVQRKNVKRSVLCHVLAQSPPGRRSNDKYIVNTSHRSDLCKNVSMLCCMVATVMHIQSLRSQMCTHTHTHTLCTIWRHWWDKRNEILGQRSMPRAVLGTRAAVSLALDWSDAPNQKSLSLLSHLAVCKSNCNMTTLLLSIGENYFRNVN
jgi:hypothetical protein